MNDDPPQSWSRAQRVLHGIIAACVALLAPMGAYMVALPFQQLFMKFVLYQLHKTVGIVVFLLALVQIVLHCRRGRPAWGANVLDWQRRAAFAVHIVLFMLLVATPCLGYLTAATAPARIPTLFLGVVQVPHIVGTNPALFAELRRAHWVCAALLMVLACGHAGMAVYHHWRGHDTLVRMWQGRFIPPRWTRQT